MHKVGDEIVVGKVVFVYQGGGNWQEKGVRSQIIDKSGTSATVKTDAHEGNNELLVNLAGHICTENSSSTALGAGATFTGDWQDTLDYGTISIGVDADQSSAINGLVVQWSADGVLVHETDVFTILANVGKTFTFGPVRRYFRIVYTNGAVAQTYFNIASALRRVYVKPSSHRISDIIVGEDDAELIKAVLTAEGNDGVFRNVPSDNAGLLRVNSFPYSYAIAEGDIQGHYSLLKFGTRTTVAANTPSTVWEGPTALYAYMSTAQQLKISSTDNVNDNVGGTGALTLTIFGLDENWLEINETVTMLGTTVVTTTNSYIRVFRAYVETSGSSYTNTGVISILNNASTVTQVVINAGDGQTLMTVWTVPAGKVAYLTQATFSTDSNKGARVSLFTRLNDGGTLYPWQIKYRAFTFSGNEVFPYIIPFEIPAKTDIEIRVNTPVAAGPTSAGATFELWYEDV